MLLLLKARYKPYETEAPPTAGKQPNPAKKRLVNLLLEAYLLAKSSQLGAKNPHRHLVAAASKRP
jgi:hypothetical protein